jgi:integrase
MNILMNEHPIWGDQSLMTYHLMFEIPPAVNRGFLAALDRESISSNRKPYFIKWLRYYLDFCDRHNQLPLQKDSLDAFLIKLSEKGQGSFQQRQVAQAVGMFWQISQKQEASNPPIPSERNRDSTFEEDWDAVTLALKRRIETLQYSKKTYATYSSWLRRFQHFTRNKNPKLVTAKDAAEFFTYLASVKKVAATTQNQAFNALLFVFRHIWQREFEGFDGVVRAKRSNYIPVVLSRKEVNQVISKLGHPTNLMVQLLYGCGLRLFECVNVRINCLNFDSKILTIHDGKGKKDRTVPLPGSLVPDLQKQVQRVNGLLDKDLENGFAGPFLPSAMSRKFKNAGKELPWQWLIPAPKLTLVPETKELRQLPCA